MQEIFTPAVRMLVLKKRLGNQAEKKNAVSKALIS